MPAGDFPHHCAGCRCFEGQMVTVPPKTEPLQACPVCAGRGWMPYGFFTGLRSGSTTENETCRPCHGTGMVRPSAVIGGDAE